MDIENRLMATAAASQWKDIGVKQHHGLVLPLFSLRSQQSSGIGEFLDLIPMIRWCREIGFDVIQLLPLNDTGHDTSPYCAISANALNPIHLSLSNLPYANNPQLAKQLEILQQFNHTQYVNYPTVMREKEKFLRDYFNLFTTSLLADPNYQSFKNENSYWLQEYALFKTLKIQLQWQSWELWPPVFKDPSPSFFNNPPSEIQLESEFHQYIQFLCFQQCEQVKKYAQENGVFLKGDIPILINKESADVWRNRQLFMLQVCAGAPPDMYSAEGQKWGFPLYDWGAIASQDYRWWINRLVVASHLYHIYRIDHVVGFFRIWAIPLSRNAKEGYFYPENPSSWIPHGETIMRMMLNNCNMLPIGEDLGTVPTEVRNSLKSLGICGTKVMRWERYWNTTRKYIEPKDYPPESMTTVSTHDSETLQQWWQNNHEEAREYAATMGWEYTPQLSSQQRMAILQASHHSGSLFHINLLQEYLALVPGMSWPNPDDERINLPGVISERNWSYRFRPTIEEITSNTDLKIIMADAKQDANQSQ